MRQQLCLKENAVPSSDRCRPSTTWMTPSLHECLPPITGLFRRRLGMGRDVPSVVYTPAGGIRSGTCTI